MLESLTVRPVRPEDEQEWIRLRTALWPDSPEDHPVEISDFLVARPDYSDCLVAVDTTGRLVGFAEFRLREYAEHCRSSPVGYLEGIYVEPEARGSGVGRRLVLAGEEWARAKGCTEMASDRALEDDGSGAFHLAVGYEETIRMVCYRKGL